MLCKSFEKCGRLPRLIFKVSSYSRQRAGKTVNCILAPAEKNSSYSSFKIMILSKHNIISRIKDSDEYFIVNLLSGNADVLTESMYKELQNGTYQNTEELINKGYLVDERSEAKLYKEKYLDFIDNRENDEVQIFFIPWYSCNFACSYCYQDEYESVKQKLTPEIISSFFTYVGQNFADRKKYITIFGGEPLLAGSYYKENIEMIISEATARNIDIAIVTNGYHIAEYIDILRKGKIREVQVTLDGTADFHDKRRYLKDHSPTFDKISGGIDLLLSNHIPVNLRMVVDRENISGLPALARYAIDKGWTKSSFFKTQLGRNYELHHCQKSSIRLYNRLNLYEDLYRLINESPEILEFHKPAFSVSKFLFENGELPEPLFDSCPACKTEWAFDYTGHIYSCTATVGKAGEELGTFYPEISINDNAICDWQERDVLAIPECKNCPVQLACGGGCGSVAKNQEGSITKPDCRPVKELLELGISLYGKDE